jgi:hypothetical protein
MLITRCGGSCKRSAAAEDDPDEGRVDDDDVAVE